MFNIVGKDGKAAETLYNKPNGETWNRPKKLHYGINLRNCIVGKKRDN